MSKYYYYEGEFIMFSSGGYNDYTVGGFYKALKPFNMAYQSQLFKAAWDDARPCCPFDEHFENFLSDKGLIVKVQYTEFYQGDYKFNPTFKEDV